MTTYVQELKPKKILPKFVPETMDIRIERCIIENCKGGIYMDGINGAVIQYNELINCLDPIYCTRCKNVTIRRNIIR